MSHLISSPETHRLLPQSSSAEKGLLSSFLLAPQEVGALCRRRGIAPAHFHLPQHALIFDHLQRRHADHLPIDIITLTQALHDAHQLDAANGPAYVSELFTYLPTAANAEHYVEILQEKYTLRALIQVCTEVATRSYAEQDNVPHILADVEQRVLQIARARAEASVSEVLGYRVFDPSKPPPQPRSIFQLGDAVIATPGNLLAVQAKAKAGKSAAIGALIASTMDPTGDCLGFVSENPEQLALVHFDTEQSPYDHYKTMMRALTRAGRSDAPPWLRSYLLTDLPLKQRREIIPLELERAKAACHGILAVIIDGIGDLCLDPNDPEEALALVDEIHRLAIKFDTAIVCVLHENPGTDIGKTRGHLGSQLERKAETNLRLEKNAHGVTVMYSERARSCFVAKDDGPRFAWDENARMHLSTTETFKCGGKAKKDPNVPRSNSRVTKAKALLGEYFAQGKSVRRSLLAAIVPAEQKIHPNSFKNYWMELKTNGLVVESRTVAGMFEASPEWARELASDYPEEEEKEA